jgi:hypothetical protein
MKKFTLLIVFFMIFSMISVIFLVNNASATSVSTGFEDGSIGSNYINSWLTTTNKSSHYFSVTNLKSHSGTKGFLNTPYTDNVQGYWNFTYSSGSYLTSFSFYSLYDHANDLNNFFEFKNVANITIVRLYVTQTDVWYFDYYGTMKSLSPIDASLWTKIGFTILANDTVLYTVNNATGSGVNRTDSPRNILVNPRIVSCRVKCDLAISYVYFDDFSMTYASSFPGGGVPSGTNTTVTFTDSSTGNTVRHLNPNNYAFMPYVVFYGTLSSDLLNVPVIFNLTNLNYWNNNIWNMYATIPFNTFTPGTYHWFNITNAYIPFTPLGINSTVYYSDLHLYIPFQNSMAITLSRTNGSIPVYVPPTVSLDDFYSNKGYDVRTHTYVETDKNIYNYGEVVAIRYKTPTKEQLRTGVFIGSTHTEGWVLGITRDNPWTTPYPGSSDFLYKFPITNYGTWNYESFTSILPTEGIDSYEIFIEHDEGRSFLNPFAYPSYLFAPNPSGNGRFTVVDNGVTIVNYGNISNITPQIAKIGDTVTIYYNATSSCSIVIRELSEPKENYRDLQVLGKPPGTISTTYIPNTLGRFIVELLVYNGQRGSYELKDYGYFNVSTTGNASGSFGFNSEYLWIPGSHFIAGYDTVSINYHSLKNNTRLTVTDAIGQRTSYSTNVTDVANTLTVDLPSNSKIGEWKVVLYGRETLYANFSVIAEEGNYIEFAKNVFWDNEPLSVVVQHTHKVQMIFYKNGIPQGQNIVLPLGTAITGYYVVPDNVIPNSIGNWKVDLWLTNNLTRIRLLSSATCIVEQAPYERPNTSLYGFDIQSLPLIVKIILSFVIIIVMTLLPMLVSVMLSKGNISIEIPSLIYVAFFFVGMIIDILLGLLEIYIFAIVLFGLILAMAITWQIQTKGSKT